MPDDARAAVWEALRDGTIDMFSSDHAPHTREEKEIGWTQMWSAHTGTPGIQYYYPLALDAVRRGQAQPRSAWSTWWRTNPAKRSAWPGARARSCRASTPTSSIADLDAPWTITNDGVLSKIGWTCYDGRECSAQIERTFVRGHEVFADGEVVGDPRTRPPRGHRARSRTDS